MFDIEIEAPRPIADLDSPEVIQASDGSQKQLAALKATVESQQASIELLRQELAAEKENRKGWQAYATEAWRARATWRIMSKVKLMFQRKL